MTFYVNYNSNLVRLLKITQMGKNIIWDPMCFFSRQLEAQGVKGPNVNEKRVHHPLTSFHVFKKERTATIEPILPI